MKVKKTTLQWTAVLVLIFVSVLFFSVYKPSRVAGNQGTDSKDAVTMEGDTQVITMAVRGGYTPRTVKAKANVKTILRLRTKNTFDCSASLSIPQLQYSEVLGSNVTKDISIPPQRSGSTITGTCVMNMYGFNITFI